MKRSLAFFFFAAIGAFILPSLKAETTLIAFLKQNFTSDQANITGDFIINKLINDEAKEWISSIDCKDIIVKAKSGSNNNSGIKLDPILAGNGENETAYLTINFNKEKMMKVEKITYYLTITDKDDVGNDGKISVSLNGSPVTMTGSIPFELNTNSASSILTSINKSIQNNTVLRYAWSSAQINNIPAESLTISDPYNSQEKNYCPLQLFAIALDYSSTTDDSDIPTSVAEISDGEEKYVEYFDMMGHKIPCEPKKGMFIRRIGDQTQKIIK